MEKALLSSTNEPSQSNTTSSSITSTSYKSDERTKSNRWRRTRLFAKTISAIESIRTSANNRSNQSSYSKSVDIEASLCNQSPMIGFCSNSKNESTRNLETKQQMEASSGVGASKTAATVTSPVLTVDNTPTIQVECQTSGQAEDRSVLTESPLVIVTTSNCAASSATTAITMNTVRAVRRSLETELISSGRSIGSPNRSGGCSPQASHVPSLAEVFSSRPSIERAFLLSSSGSHQIPDNHNTNLINQLNKNYLKSICKQNKARSDWKSLKAKLSALRRRDSGEKTNADNPPTNSSGLQLPASTPSGSKRGSLETNTPTSAGGCGSLNATEGNQAKRVGGQDEGIICRKEDLIRLLQAATPTKQGRKPLKSISDVVLQLRSDGRLNSSNSKKKSPTNDMSTEANVSIEENQSKTNIDTSNEQRTLSDSKSKEKDTSSGSSNASPSAELADDNSKKCPSEKSNDVQSDKKQKVRSSLKSSVSSSRTRASTIVTNTSQVPTVRKKKVKIVDSESTRTKTARNVRMQPEGRSSKEKLSVKSKSSNAAVITSSRIDEVDQIENVEERLRRECLLDSTNEQIDSLPGNQGANEDNNNNFTRKGGEHLKSSCCAKKETIRKANRNKSRERPNDVDVDDADDDDDDDNNNDDGNDVNDNEDGDEDDDDDNNRVKWDEGDLVDATALGDAIQAFLRGISSTPSEKKVSFKR